MRSCLAHPSITNLPAGGHSLGERRKGHVARDQRPAPRHGDQRRAPAQSRFLRQGAGSPVCQAHGQFRRPERLPPLLRRRDRRARHGDDLLSLGASGARPPRHGEPALVLADPDRLPLALVVATEPDVRLPWTTPEIGAEQAVRGFHSVSLCLEDRAATADLLIEVMGYERVASAGRVHRYAAPHSPTARCLDLVEDPNGAPAASGRGAVHHIAFAVAGDAAQDHFRQKLIDAGYRVTPRIDRTYFHSIYFHTPGGVLFEIATEGPGFTVDEPRETLGHSLRLPAQHEHLRARLEQRLAPLQVPR